jgi:formylglycine-generating enzyme required for sulfatase activity
MGKIFISYRRDDSSYATDGIYEKLVEKYGRKFFFKDVDDIRAGVDFRKVIEEDLQECDILLAVIGKKWLSVKNANGNPRLFDENDFVRIEIETALKRDIPVKTGSEDYFKNMCLQSNCPIIGVSWNNAKAYANWLSKKTDKKYSLPSEAQWEYVARAKTESMWSFGDKKSDLKEYAWYNENAHYKGKGHKDYGTHQVGTKKSNSWGLHDMHGNVWEWCDDWYVNNYKGVVSDGSSNQSGEQEAKVLRGGSWFSNSDIAESSSRVRDYPTNRSSDFGFRLQRTLP